jgi:hypothetical protein
VIDIAKLEISIISDHEKTTSINVVYKT